MAYKIYGRDEGETSQPSLKSMIQPTTQTPQSSTSGFKSFEELANWSNGELAKANAAGVKPDAGVLANGGLTTTDYNNLVKDAVAKTSVGLISQVTPSTGTTTGTPQAPTYTPTPTQTSNPTKDNSELYKQMYAKQLEATVAKIRQAIALGKSKQQDIINKAPQQYQPLRDQASYQGEKNIQNLREMLSNDGQQGGVNRTEQTQVSTATQNEINDYNRQQQNVIDNANKAIADLEAQGQFEEAQAVADNANQMLSALMAESNRVDSENYSRLRDQIGDTNYANEQLYSKYRDSVGDSRYADEQAYGKLRDQIGDTRYADEQAYNRLRDQVGDTRYADELSYSRGRDGVSDQRYKDEQDYSRGRDVITDKRYDKEYADRMAQQKLQDQLTKQQIDAATLENEMARAKNKYVSQFALSQLNEQKFNEAYAKARAKGYSEEQAATIAVKNAQVANYQNQSVNRTAQTKISAKKATTTAKKSSSSSAKKAPTSWGW